MTTEESPSSRSPVAFVIGTSIWLALISNAPLWVKVLDLPEMDGLAAIGFVAAFMIAIAAATSAVLALVAWGWVLKPVLSVFVVVAAAVAYFAWMYGVVVDPTMIANVIQTDPREVRDLLDIRFLLALALLAGIPLVVIWKTPLASAPIGRLVRCHLGMLLGGSAVTVAAVLLVFQPMAATMRNHTQLRYLITPLNTIYAIAKYGATGVKRSDSVLVNIGVGAQLQSTADTEPPLLLLVLGETAREDNFSNNGYPRDTTPLLSSRSDLFSSKNAWSCGTSTAESVPCMFSHLGRDAYGRRKFEYENLLDVLQRAGLAVLWLDNQSGCKGVCDRIPSQKLSQPDGSANCSPSGECQDIAMLSGLAERIEALPAEQRARGTVVVLHQMGSHGPAYSKRSQTERKRFLPECQSAALQTCSREEVVNAYDNSIVETDYFLANSIQWLAEKYKSRPTALMYVSDHGESLGESNLYLHGLPYAFAPDVQKNIPWIVWMSDRMQIKTGIATHCMQAKRVNDYLSHDNYFHSVLGLLDIRAEEYNESLDMFRPCDSTPRQGTHQPMT